MHTNPYTVLQFFNKSSDVSVLLHLPQGFKIPSTLNTSIFLSNKKTQVWQTLKFKSTFWVGRHQWYSFFHVLLTVHPNIFISVFNHLDAENLFHNKFYFMPVHASSTCAGIIRRSKLHYTVLWYHHTYSCDDTRGLCNAILTSWWWAHVLETCTGMKYNLLWNKFCASSLLNT